MPATLRNLHRTFVRARHLLLRSRALVPWFALLLACGRTGASDEAVGAGTNEDAPSTHDAGASLEGATGEGGASKGATGSDGGEADASVTPPTPCIPGYPAVQCVATASVDDHYECIAVDDANVYVAVNGQNATQDEILAIPRQAGSPAILAKASTGSLASDGSYLYWLEASAVVRVPVGGGSVATLAPAADPYCVTVDDTNVYWSDTTGVLAVPKSGGAVVTLYPAPQVYALVTDSTTVYAGPSPLPTRERGR